MCVAMGNQQTGVRKTQAALRTAVGLLPYVLACWMAGR